MLCIRRLRTGAHAAPSAAPHYRTLSSGTERATAPPSRDRAARPGQARPRHATPRPSPAKLRPREWRAEAIHEMLTSWGWAGTAEATPPRLFKAARRCRRGSEGGGGAARGGRVLGGTAQLPPSGSLVCLGALPPPRGRGQPPPGLHVCALSPALVSGRCLLPVSGGGGDAEPGRSVSCPGVWSGGRGGEGAAG